MQWLRRRFLTGLVVTVPLFITVVTLVWLFRFIDGVATPLSTTSWRTTSRGSP